MMMMRSYSLSIDIVTLKLIPKLNSIGLIDLTEREWGKSGNNRRIKLRLIFRIEDHHTSN